jgi:hypothetical protein
LDELALDRQDKPMRLSVNSEIAKLGAIAAFTMALYPAAVQAAPTAEVAKRCVHYSYIAYPWKRPGSGPMSGDRQAYINDCFAKNGDVPVPKAPARKN